MTEDFQADMASEDKIEKTVENMAVFQTGYMTKEFFKVSRKKSNPENFVKIWQLAKLTGAPFKDITHIRTAWHQTKLEDFLTFREKRYSSVHTGIYSIKPTKTWIKDV